ncbi:single-stranded DNA-binding protein [Patescibacteria group bacterium]|nr:single-stranded DNA-binding protein [Patescibacteria group bacterium]
MYLNKAIIIGNLTRGPELKALPSGIQVANMGVATNRVWKDKEGNKQEAVEFHNVVVFGRQAETSAQYLKKGSSVLVEGRLQTQSWEADGVKKYRTEIVAERIQFGPRKDGGSYTPTAQSSNNGDDQSAEAPKSEGIDYPTEEINPDDIPF